MLLFIQQFICLAIINYECPKGWTINPLNQHCYFLEEEQVDIEEADEDCKEKRSFLTSVHSAEEQAFLTGNI